MTAPHRSFTFYSGEGIPVRLELRADAAGEGGDCPRLHLPVDAAEILWVGPVPPRDAADPAPVVALQGAFGADAVSVSETEWLQPEVPGSGAGRVDGESSREGGASPPTHPGTVSRGAWIWSPAAWSTPEGLERLWETVRAEELKVLYLTVPVEDGTVSGAARLEAFIHEAGGRGIAVWAVSGDPRDVLPEARAALLERARAYATYNGSVDPGARLAGAQLDVEPYLLPGFALAPGYWRDRYLDMHRAVLEALDDAMPLDLVVPFWWGTHPDWGDAFFHAVARPGTSLTVMNYRTQPDALRAGARPFLEAGDRDGFKVRVAVETGPLPDETRRTFRRADPGIPATLWLVDAGGLPALVLLSMPRTELPGIAYAFSHEATARAGNLTFGTDRERREAALRALVPEWSAHRSFSGIALHGLDAPQP